tara:strand:- start:297 stop:437 length:141 start_codon:yes stop_codon:yes gene_type:complete
MPTIIQSASFELRLGGDIELDAIKIQGYRLGKALLLQKLPLLVAND